MNKQRDKQKQIDIHTNREKYKTDRSTNTEKHKKKLKKAERHINRQTVKQQSEKQPY